MSDDAMNHGVIRQNSPEGQKFLDFEGESPRSERLLSPDEIFASADESLLEKLREDHRIEWKSSRFSGDHLGEYFSMWANTPPDGGLVVSGMLNDGTIEGCNSLSQEALNHLRKVGPTFCPDARFEVKTLRFATKPESPISLSCFALGTTRTGLLR